jgi:hypothetical protein
MRIRNKELESNASNDLRFFLKNRNVKSINEMLIEERATFSFLIPHF